MKYECRLNAEQFFISMLHDSSLVHMHEGVYVEDNEKHDTWEICTDALQEVRMQWFEHFWCVLQRHQAEVAA